MDNKYRDLLKQIEELKEQVEKLEKKSDTVSNSEKEAPAGKKSARIKDYHWLDKKILIVEDNDVNYLILQNILKKTHAQLIWAKGGMMALEICKSDHDIDIVLMDIMIPNFDGISATQKIREIRPDLPVIIQTAYPSPENKSRSREAGCSGFLEKPINKDKLLNMISEHIL